MKNNFRTALKFGILLLVAALWSSCGDAVEAREANASSDAKMDADKSESSPKPLSEDFKTYWYAGEAEITSYELEQARYGELRQGHAVLVYVTEPFLPEVQVKADSGQGDPISVMKLNSTKNYLTGIYPYSIMTSTFYPVGDHQHALKVSTSVQEWCGHVYSQLNNREAFEIDSHSYFEGEADQSLKLEKTWLESEIWNKIRINPSDLPLGEITMIPSFEYIRTGHKKFAAYKAEASKNEEDGLVTYTISYPELNRSLSIQFQSKFPHSIEGWTETFRSGFGGNARELTSKATKMKTLKTAYWRQNSNEDEVLRKELGI